MVAFDQATYTTTESNAVTLCATIVNGTIERPQPVLLTMVSSPGTASRKNDALHVATCRQ